MSSNLYLSHQMVLDRDRFFERLKHLYDGWKSSDIVDCILIAVGDDYGSISSKSTALHIWLFGYELNDTVCVFTRGTAYILTGKKEIEFLKPLEISLKTDDNNEPSIQLLTLDWNDDKSIINLLNVIDSSLNGKPIGVFGNDEFLGPFGELWQTEMAAYNFQTTDIEPLIAYVMAVKDDHESNTIREACLVSVDIFEKYLKQNISEIIKAKKRVKHSQLAKGVEQALNDKKFVFNADTSQLECCYLPIIQSGADYDLKFNAGSNDAYLDFGVIVCSLGVRYKSYCSNMSRTLLIKPTKIIEKNHKFLLNLEKHLFNSLVPGAKLNEIYQSALNYAKRVKPHLVDHLTETFGSVIGIEFHERALAIGPKCMAVVKKGMMFNVCVGVDRLTDMYHGSDSNDGKSYALLHSNTVIVNEFGPATSLTSPPPYLKLNADCLDHIFDYLPFNDIMSMALTCIRMHRMAGYYVRECFPELQYTFGDGELDTEYSNKRYNPSIDFWCYIETLVICDTLNFSLDSKTFSSLKILKILYSSYLDEIQFNHLRNVLKNIETIRFECHIMDLAFEQLSELCPKLKGLQFCDGDDPDYRHRAILQQHFPLLEHLEYRPRHYHIDEINAFLVRHTNLKQLKCNASFLWTHRDVFNEINVQLNVLTIYAQISIIQTNEFADFLQHLFTRGFFRKIELLLDFRRKDDPDDTDFDILSNLISTWPALEKLYIHHDFSRLDLSRLVNLKELQFSYNYPTTDFEKMAKSLTKLERVTLVDSPFNETFPFFRYCSRLKIMEIQYFWSNVDMNLVTLNEERKQFDENASQVWIYVPDDIYLREKWKSENINLSHVKIVRLKG